MERLKLSHQTKEIIKRLIASKDSEKVGYIAAVDPKTGEIFYGKDEVEAVKEGRKAKNDPKAVFFFVRVGYPSVHVLKSVNLQGYIHQLYFPLVKSYIQNGSLHIVSSIHGDAEPLDLVANTGFSGSLVLDEEVLQGIDKDYIGEDTVTIAGGFVQQVYLYLSNVFVNTLKLTEVKIFGMKGEYLIGIEFMRAICKRVIFAFDNNKVLFEE